jgi:hypothetical protein
MANKTSHHFVSGLNLFGQKTGVMFLRSKILEVETPVFCLNDVWRSKMTVSELARRVLGGTVLVSVAASTFYCTWIYAVAIVGA